jgi:glutamate-1-semialdehyde 2,1-aminomutase
LTAGIYGHSHPVIREAIISTFDNVGVNLGSTIIQEQKYAALICSRFGLDRVRFANSGTEANLHALNGAKHFTGRSKVVVFGGGYHGAVLSFGGGKVAPNNVNKDEWVVGRYNDVESAHQVIENTPDLAAVIVEAMQGSGGCIAGTKEFLHQVQDSAKRAGAVFILDEVMTSRLAPGGLQSVLGLKPDMMTFGKYLGGGFAFGGFGGRADIMAVYDPRSDGSLVHSGTFNNNTMAMHAGYAGLSQILTPEVTVAFSAKGETFRKKLQDVSKGTKFFFTGVGSLIMTHVTDMGDQILLRGEDVTERNDIKDLFWFEMMEDGFWIHRRGSISLVLETPDEELDRFVHCFSEFLKRHRDVVTL